ncbi:glycosyltransferase [Photobacterium leiognathi]|uniref:glycosyltransferase n=1 Tax=Photobacterium leiognathi TaxID=553611 RepID=UPI0029821744|nr:glycosyltransferase [Photobacterium leiognathi]
MKKVTIITHLPFRKKGNQSLKRFVEMFLSRGQQVVLISDGIDGEGENVISHPNFKLIRIEGNRKGNSITFNKTTSTNYSDIKSKDIFLPYLEVNKFRGIVKKQVDFLLNTYKQNRIYNIITKSYFSAIEDSDIVIGYEASRTFVAKKISKKINAKYINKFQGTILAVCKRNSIKAAIFYPRLYFGLNKADLCLMVNDGTDGAFWAKAKGNNKIRFRPHGVANKEYPKDVNLNDDEKFVIFNNASSSNWKRPDRIIRALSTLETNYLDKILFKTTFFGPNKQALVEYIDKLGLSNVVEFCDNFNHIDSNIMIRKSDLFTMTNDMSNLGNPILESIYYNTPFISINDRSLDDVCDYSSGAILVDLDDDFDNNFANEVRKLIDSKKYYNTVKDKLERNDLVKSLDEEQQDEYETIKKSVCL